MRHNTNIPPVSILVPVYNAAPTLKRCLDSLASQTLRFIEIICMDDGSTDESAAILDAYAMHDNRFRVIHKTNSGYGDTLNQAIDLAQGEYFGIVEPDDFAGKGMFKTLYQTARIFESDVVKGNYYYYADPPTDDRRKAENVAISPLVDKIAEDAVEGAEVGMGNTPDKATAGAGTHTQGSGLLDHATATRRPARKFDIIYGSFNYWKPIYPADDPRIVLVRPAIWTGLYRTAFIRNADITFTPSPGAAFQDIAFNHQCMIAANSVKLIRTPYYHYNISNEGSSFNSGEKHLSVCDEHARVFAFLETRGSDAMNIFAPWLNFAHFDTCIWNFNRIKTELKAEFCMRWAQDVEAATDAGLMKADILPQAYQNYVAALLSDPIGFCEAHTENGIESVPFI